MKTHLQACRRGTPPPSQTYTLSPDETLWPNSEITCALCSGSSLVAHPTTGNMYGTCAKWDDPLHRDRDAARQVFNEQQRARRAAGTDHVMTQARGDQIIKWREQIATLGCSREDELVAWLALNGGWRATDTVDRADSLEALAGRLEITTYSGYMDRLTSRLSLVDPANLPRLNDGTNYYQACQSVQTLARYPGGDGMFGGLSPLTTLLLCGTVESRLLVLVDAELRRVRAPMRKAASGFQSRHVVRRESQRRSTDTRGLGLLRVNLLESGVMMGSAFAQRRRWLDLGFGLTTKADGMSLLVQRLPRQTRVADPTAVKIPDCDFGGLSTLEVIYQVPNVKLDGEGLVGNLTTRQYSRPANLGIARVLQTIGHGDRFTFQVCCRGKDVVRYEINGANWRVEMGQAAVHFLQTYDTAVYDKHVAADPSKWARKWTGHLLEEDGCGGVIYGLPFSLVIKDETYGRCPFTDPVFCHIADVLDRTACLIALNRDYDWSSDQPRDNTSILPEWPGERSMREELLRAATPCAWAAKRIAEVEILPRVVTAFATEDGDVNAALRAGYAAVAHGAQTMGARAFLDDVRQRYVDTVAPTVLEELGRDRRFVIETWDLGNLDAGPVSTSYRFVRRNGLDDLLAPETSRLPPVPRASSPGRGDVDAVTSALAASPGNFQASSDDDDAALPEVPKSRSRRRRRARRRRPPDGSTQPDSTARSLGAGGLPPVL